MIDYVYTVDIGLYIPNNRWVYKYDVLVFILLPVTVYTFKLSPVYYLKH